MTDRAFLKTFSGLLAALVALTVIIFVVAQMVSGSGKAKTKVAQTAQSEVAARIKPVGELVVASAAAVANGVVPTAKAADGKGTYDKACMACHAAGVAGAPKLGDKADWGPRIAQGNDTLYTHALKGFQGKKGMMPAKGGNMSLSDADVKASVDYMVGQSK
ncbi:MAG TPA: c-type cytochrome [Acidiferrobacterales bacterium]|nr:c-type cytochrome [Acidiferrobacterales bacterium]